MCAISYAIYNKYSGEVPEEANVNKAESNKAHNEIEKAFENNDEDEENQNNEKE